MNPTAEARLRLFTWSQARLARAGGPPRAGSTLLAQSGVGAGLQFEAGGDALEQVEQLPEFCLVQRVGYLSVEAFCMLFRPSEEPLPDGGQVEVANAAIACVGSAFEKVAVLELVDDCDHPAGGDMQPFGERVLGLAFAGPDRPQ